MWGRRNPERFSLLLHITKKKHLNSWDKKIFGIFALKDVKQWMNQDIGRPPPLHNNFVKDRRSCWMNGRMAREGFVADMPPLECQLATTIWLELSTGWRLTPLCPSILPICNLLISGALAATGADGPLPLSLQHHEWWWLLQSVVTQPSPLNPI